VEEEAFRKSVCQVLNFSPRNKNH